MKKRFFAFTLLLLLVAVSLPLRSGGQGKYPLETKYVGPELKELVSSKLGVVTAAHPFAANAGIEMLRKGGNVVDAAVAASMVTAVVDIGLSSLAGGGCLNYYDAKTRQTKIINLRPNSFREDVMPYVGESDNKSGRGTKVSGTFAGYYLAIQKYGKLTWKEIVEPCIFYAENGFPIFGDEYSALRSYYAVLTMRSHQQKIFAPQGFLPRVGQLLKQPEMAETLKKIAEQGPDYFYKGAFAEEMVKVIRDAGGKATLNDFSSYKPLEMEPVRGTYKRYQITGPPYPAVGSSAVIEGLNVLENVDLKEMGHYSQSADSLQWMIETLDLITTDASRYSGVPEFDRSLAQILTSKSYAKTQYEIIRHKIDQMKRQADERPKSEEAGDSFSSWNYDTGETNHTSAVDKDGSVCSITHSIMGPSAMSVHGLWVGGLVLNGAGGFRSIPGERVVSPGAPIIVLDGDTAYFACGSSSGHPNPFFLASNILVWDKNFKDAQEAPRFRVRTDTVSIEHRIDEKITNELKRRGYKIEWSAPYSMGNAQLAGIESNSGIHLGAADPRGRGEAVAQK